jgi:hypothetical protein
MMEAAFYCVSSEMYFPGAVGMLNSLRLQGHTEPVFMLDCGLSPAHRELLAPHVTLVPGPSDTPPHLLKTLAPLRHPAEVMVLIDADMIVTRPLSELIQRASEDRILAFENDRQRFVPQWGDLLDLGTARRQRYLSSGLVFLGGSVGAEVLGLLQGCQARAQFDLSLDIRQTDAPDHPFLYLEQDVLNAILSTRVDSDRIIALDNRLAANPPFQGLRLVDEGTLRCAFGDGTEPYVIHQYVRKPWLEPMYHGVYPRLLSRLLLGEDVAVRVPEREVPRRMRNGPRARAVRMLVNARDLGRWYLAERLPRWIDARVAAVRRRRAAGRP